MFPRLFYRSVLIFKESVCMCFCVTDYFDSTGLLSLDNAIKVRLIHLSEAVLEFLELVGKNYFNNAQKLISL